MLRPASSFVSDLAADLQPGSLGRVRATLACHAMPLSTARTITTPIP
jgi:hypothetical protein